MADSIPARAFIPLNIAVLTVSDTRSLDDDKSGATLAERLTAAGHRLAAPRRAPAPQEELARAELKVVEPARGEYTGTDFYCDVALKGTVALRKEYESDAVLAYHHTRPFWPVHIVVIPKKHIDSFITLS